VNRFQKRKIQALRNSIRCSCNVPGKYFIVNFCYLGVPKIDYEGTRDISPPIAFKKNNINSSVVFIRDSNLTFSDGFVMICPNCGKRRTFSA